MKETVYLSVRPNHKVKKVKNKTKNPNLFPLRNSICAALVFSISVLNVFCDLFKFLWLFFFHREDYSFTAYATISYLKVGPRACLLNNEAHAVTMQVKRPAPSTARVTGIHFQCVPASLSFFTRLG